MPPLAHAFPFSTLFAAQFTPISADFQLNAWSLLSVVLGILAVLGYFRRRPTIDVDLSKLQSSIETLQATVDRLSVAQASYASHEAEIAQLKEQVSRLNSARETEAQTQRSHLAKLSREIFDRIEKVESSFANNLQRVERTLGQIEGKLDVMRDRLT